MRELPYSLFILAILVVAGSASAQSPTLSEDLEAAKAAFKARNDKVRSLRAKLDEEMIQHVEHFKLAAKLVRRQKNVIPDRDIVDKYHSTVTLLDGNFRYDYTASLWSFETGKLETMDYTSAWNGSAATTTLSAGESFPRPRTSLNNRSAGVQQTAFALWPLMLTIRSQHPDLKQLSDFAPTGAIIPVEGRDCLELVKGSRPRVEYLYLDRGRDWTIRRIDEFSQGKLTLRVTAEYASDPVVGWLPRKWSYAMRSPQGEPLVSGTVTALSYEINEGLSQSEFTPKSAPGAFVVDNTHDVGKTTVSIVKDDGSPGVALPLSQRPTDEQLLMANAQATRSQKWRFYLMFGLVFLIGAATYWIYRRRTKLRKQEI